MGPMTLKNGTEFTYNSITYLEVKIFEDISYQKIDIAEWPVKLGKLRPYVGPIVIFSGVKKYLTTINIITLLCNKQKYEIYDHTMKALGSIIGHF